MKHLLTAIVFIVATYSAMAQYEVVEEQPEKAEKKEIYSPTIFFGMGMGINNNCGLIGALIEAGITRNFSFTGGVGIGGWGLKTSAGLRFYRHYMNKLYYGAAYTRAFGGENREVELQTTRSGENTEKVILNYNQASNIALTIGYQFRLWKNGRINLETGYSIPINTDVYELVTTNVELSDISKSVMELMTPGGLMLGFGFTIGF